MPRYVNALSDKDFVIRLQWVFIALLFVLASLALWGWQAAPRNEIFHVPPDLRSGAAVRRGEVPPANVYAFAYYIWQQLNRWPEDGDRDYGAAMYRMQAYVTPACHEKLKADMKQKADNGELTLRTRALQEIEGHEYEEWRVAALGNGVWTVTVDAEIAETVRGIAVKNTGVRYALRVVRFDVDREKNPFGLAIDCFDDGEPPRRLDLAGLRQARAAAQRPGSPAGGAAGRLQDALTR